jgi:class 3 adenylate cyclase
MQLEFDAMMQGRVPEERTALKIGVNSGRVLAGTVGGRGRLEYTAVGDAVNVASRLTAEAGPGDVLVTSATLGQLGGRFAARPLGERVLRGRTEPVHVYAVEREDARLATVPVGREET